MTDPIALTKQFYELLLTDFPAAAEQFLADDGIVAAIGVERDTLVLPTGKRYDMPFVHVIRFNDEGKVTHVREYNDTREMVAAFTAD